MAHVKMVTPTLMINVLISMSVNWFVPMQQMRQRSAIDVRQAPFAQIMWAATNAQDHGSADRFSLIGPVQSSMLRMSKGLDWHWRNLHRY